MSTVHQHHKSAHTNRGGCSLRTADAYDGPTRPGFARSGRGALSLLSRDMYDGPVRGRTTSRGRGYLTTYWSKQAALYRRASGDDSDDSLYDLAINRLANGDVTDTQYGVRVALREDLGDDRISAGAYWPRVGEEYEARRRCLCRSMKSRGFCSHDLAARILRYTEPARLSDTTDWSRSPELSICVELICQESSTVTTPARTFRTTRGRR